MPNVDINVDADLRKLFNLPPCADISIPGPKPLKVALPFGGGTISAFADISKGIPTDCSMTFSLMLQLAPFLAATECLIDVLKLLKPLIKIISGLPKPPSPGLLVEFAEAAKPVLECALKLTPLGIVPFIRDLLCLILRVLNCFLGQMKSLLKILDGIELRLQLANSTDNAELQRLVECAQANANAQAQHLMSSLEPVGVLLDLASGLFDLAGVPAIKLPGAAPADLTSMHQLVQDVQAVTAVIQVTVDALGGCPQ